VTLVRPANLNFLQQFPGQDRRFWNTFPSFARTFGALLAFAPVVRTRNHFFFSPPVAITFPLIPRQLFFLLQQLPVYVTQRKDECFFFRCQIASLFFLSSCSLESSEVSPIKERTRLPPLSTPMTLVFDPDHPPPVTPFFVPHCSFD